MPRALFRLPVALLMVVALTGLSVAQEPPAQPAQDRPGRAQPAEPKPYDQVITKDARSDSGVFTVHRIKDKVYYEIPKSELNREFLWVSIEIIAERLNGRQAATDDQRAFFRGELRSLNRSLTAALAKTPDRATRLHLEDARDQITKTLDPKFAPPAPAGPATPPGLPGVDDAVGCWPDYAIRKEPR